MYTFRERFEIFQNWGLKIAQKLPKFLNFGPGNFSGKKFKFSKNLSKVLQTIQISKFIFSKNLNFQWRTEKFRKFAVLGQKNENSFQKSVKNCSFELEKFQNFCIFLAEKP